MARRIPVFVCDPQPLTRSGIEHAVGADARFSVVGSAANVAACAEADDAGPVVYILDQAPGDGYDATLIEKLIAADPTRRVIAYSAYDRIALIANAYSAGASAFVSKLSPADRLLATIETVHRHADARDRYFPGTLAAALANYHCSGGAAAAAPRRLLTRRQLEIYVGAANGQSVDELSARLHMNRRTVGNQLVIIRKKLKIPREHFRSHAIEHGLVDPLRAVPAPGEDSSSQHAG